MQNDLFAFSDFFDVQLRATSDIKIGNREIEAGESILLFDNIQSASFSDDTQLVHARGGYKNPPRVTWETTKEIQLVFTQGVLSKTHLALMTNAAVVENQSVLVPMVEELETNEESAITLKHLPTNLFVYDEDGERLRDFVLTDKKLEFDNKPFMDLKVIYDYLYKDSTTIMTIGRHWLNGYLELRGKTRLKDDKTGLITTGIILIPKLKLMSDLSIRLGDSAQPVLGVFNAVAYPFGARGEERIMDFILLSEDIDSDL